MEVIVNLTPGRITPPVGGLLCVTAMPTRVSIAALTCEYRFARHALPADLHPGTDLQAAAYLKPSRPRHQSHALRHGGDRQPDAGHDPRKQGLPSGIPFCCACRVRQIAQR